MGRGYTFKCKKCQNEYGVSWGIGGAFPHVYRSCLSDITAGKYGEEWKELALSYEHIAVDAARYLYVCKFCGNWKVEKSLSLYKAKSLDTINDSLVERISEEYSGFTFVMPSELNDNFIFLKSYVHKCEKCGKRMCKTDIRHLQSLPCPKCGTENETKGMLWWD